MPQTTGGGGGSSSPHLVHPCAPPPQGPAYEFGYRKDLESRVVLKELLGAGQYGRVYAAEDKQSGTKYAVKSIPKSLPGLDARTLANYRGKIRREVDTQIALARSPETTRRRGEAPRRKDLTCRCSCGGCSPLALSETAATPDPLASGPLPEHRVPLRRVRGRHVRASAPRALHGGEPLVRGVAEPPRWLPI